MLACVTNEVICEENLGGHEKTQLNIKQHLNY